MSKRALIACTPRMTLERHSGSISQYPSSRPRNDVAALEFSRIRSNCYRKGSTAGGPSCLKPPPASSRNPAFQSKLEPYREFIRECRSKRWSYPRNRRLPSQGDSRSERCSNAFFSFVKVRAKRRRLYAPASAGIAASLPIRPTTKAREFFTSP